MGIFGYDYNKPGPGVSKDEPKKKGIALYFQLFFRHIWDFIKENFTYIISSLPVIIIYYIIITVLDIFSLQGYATKNNMWLYYEFVKFFIITCNIICGSGPSSAAMAHMMRCVTREEHCFLWSDFIEKFKENFKQSMIISIIDIVTIPIAIPVSLKFYYDQFAVSSNYLWLIPLIFVFMVSLIYVLSHIYFYQFIITYKLKFGQAVRNSIIMTLAHFPSSLLIAVTPLAIIVVLTSFLGIPYVISFVPICLFSFMRYPIEFFASRKIQKTLSN